MSFNLSFKFMYDVLGYKIPLVIVDIPVGMVDDSPHMLLCCSG
jgi:hypothetical protein